MTIFIKTVFEKGSLRERNFILKMYSNSRLLPESARWLFATGRVKRGKDVLARMARINGTELPEDYEICQEVTSSSAMFLRDPNRINSFMHFERISAH